MKPKLIHETDLFHPHGDPDDHFDLSSVYSLAYCNNLDIENIIIDYPPPHREGDPALIAVGQLNYITGLDVPVTIGTPLKMRSRDDKLPDAESRQLCAINKIINILKTAEEPVIISIVGACHDIAVAGKRAPELFRQKCAGIYLNAGTGCQEDKEEAELEYNVKLNAAAFAAIFDMPCPVYWLPCYHSIPKAGMPDIGEFGTMYPFQQKEIFQSLSPRMKNYFIYMLQKSYDPKWLRYLEKEPDRELVRTFGDMTRRMWSTAAFLHIVGKSVNQAGKIVSLDNTSEKPVFSFEPIHISCSDLGVTKWEFDASSIDRYIFRVNNLEKYKEAMTKALAELLSQLP